MFCFCGSISLGLLSSNRLQGQECILFYNIATQSTFVTDFSKASHWKTTTHVYTHNEHTNISCVQKLSFSASFDFKWPCKFAMVCMFYSKVTIGVPCLRGTALTLSHPAVPSLAHLPQSACANIATIFMWINPPPPFLYSWRNAWWGDVRLTYKILSRSCPKPE